MVDGKPACNVQGAELDARESEEVRLELREWS